MLSTDEFYGLLQEHKQLYEDWTTKPFVDVAVKNLKDGCPRGWEPMFTRTWNGTHDICYERDVNGGYAQILESKDM